MPEIAFFSKDIATSLFLIKDVPDGNVTMISQSGFLAAGMGTNIASISPLILEELERDILVFTSLNSRIKALKNY